MNENIEAQEMLTKFEWIMTTQDKIYILEKWLFELFLR